MSNKYTYYPQGPNRKKEIVEEEEVCDRAWGRENDARLTHPGAISEVRAGKSKREPSGSGGSSVSSHT